MNPYPPESVSGRSLSFEEREDIAAGVAAGLSQAQIARRLGRCASTISREIARYSRVSFDRIWGPLSDIANRMGGSGPCHPAAGGDEAHRAFEAMLTMGRIDVAAIDAARRGD